MISDENLYFFSEVLSSSKYDKQENGSLVIKDLNNNDAGYYECKGQNKLGIAQAAIKISFNQGTLLEYKNFK